MASWMKIREVLTIELAAVLILYTITGSMPLASGGS